jgi:pilus assembly protein CpaE
MIPSSAAVPASVNRGVPIVLNEPKHPVSQALRAFSDKYILGTSSAAPVSAGPLARPDQSLQEPKAHRRLFHKGVK